VAEYGQSIHAAQEFLTGCGFNLDELIAANGFDKQSLIMRGVNAVCETDERRKTFEVMAEDIAARFRGIFPNHGLYAYDKQENAISAIYNRLQESKESPDVSEMLQALYDVIDMAGEGHGSGSGQGRDYQASLRQPAGNRIYRA
jgi:type I restriction enzyme R subunit